MKATYFQGLSGQWYWLLTVERGGEIIYQSNPYTRRASARRGLWRFVVAMESVEVPF